MKAEAQSSFSEEVAAEVAADKERIESVSEAAKTAGLRVLPQVLWSGPAKRRLARLASLLSLYAIGPSLSYTYSYCLLFVNLESERIFIPFFPLRLKAAIQPYVARLLLPASSAAVVKPQVAARALASSRFRLSKFGPYCPVAMKEEGEYIGDPAANRCPAHPVLYRQHVYCCSSAKAARSFVGNPTFYLRQDPAPPSRFPSALIVGPPLR